jgi:kynurenine formamidase
MTCDVEYFKDVGKRLTNWGRWGGDDQRGTLNFITPDRLVRAARLICTGKTFSLAVPIEGRGHAGGWTRRTDPVHLMSLMPHDLQFSDGAQFADDYVAMPVHCGTQWDGLAHCAYDGLMFNGVPISEVSAAGCASRLGIEHLAGGIAGRGVLLDVAALENVDCLPAGYVVTPAHLDAAERRQGVRVGAGDILLVRTGLRRKMRAAGRTHRGDRHGDREGHGWCLEPEPGLSQGCCAWLHAREVAAVASDNYALEVIPVEDRRATLPVHCVLIRDMGMTVGELFDLEALTEDSAVDGVWEFFFAAPPLHIAHALGSPINPLAIK